MGNTADEMIRSLDAFVPDENLIVHTVEMYDILRGFNELPADERTRVVPAIFGVLERYPEEDFGNPGPLVHAIETLPTERYEARLLESVRRRPGHLNVWMVHRILNVSEPERQNALTAVLRGVLSNPNATDEARESVEEFLAYDAGESSD
jgi:hypothetical protein